MAAKKAGVPAFLAESGRELWSSIADAHELGPEARRILLDACGEADVVSRLEVELRDSPLMVRGSRTSWWLVRPRGCVVPMPQLAGHRGISGRNAGCNRSHHAVHG